MASNVLIGDWSTGLWQDLGQPTSTSALSISGYATQPSTLGTLNARIGTCFSGARFMGTGVVFDTIPDITYSQLAIVDAMYRVSFYSQLALANLGQGGDNTPFQTLKEGDSVIQLVNAANLGKEYREEAKDWMLNLNYLINAYLGQHQYSRSVDFFNPGSIAWSFPYGNGEGVSYGG